MRLSLLHYLEKAIPYCLLKLFPFEVTDLLLLMDIHNTIIWTVYVAKLTIIYSLQKYLTLYQTLYQKCMTKITL